MNRADVEMLNSSLQNAGNDALRRKQLTQEHESEMNRQLLESQMRDIQEARYGAQEAHFNKMEEGQAAANQPKIQATITHPDTGTTVDFTGTADQLQAMQDKEPGLKISNKKQYSAVFKVGDGTFAFQDEDSANKFAADVKAKNGIDVYKEQPTAPTKPLPNFNTTQVKQVLNPDYVAGKSGSQPTLSLTNQTSRVSQPMAQPPAAMAAAPAPAPTQPNQADVDWLNADPNPARLATFEKKYGQGSSTNYLKSANNLAVQ